MALAELLHSAELAKSPKKRVIVIGDNWSDHRNEVTAKLADYFEKNDLHAEVEIVINSVNIENAISSSLSMIKSQIFITRRLLSVKVSSIT